MRRVRRMRVVARGREEALVLLRKDELRCDGARGCTACFRDVWRAGRGLRDGGDGIRSDGDHRTSGKDCQLPGDTAEK